MITPEIHDYKPTEQVTLQIHAFRPEGASAGRPHPGIVLFFCGGWGGFNYRKLYAQSQYFASRGLVCLNAGVRVRQHGALPDTILRDAKSAVRWARAHAGKLGLDPHRVAAGGGSAAGHISACLGCIEGFDDPADDPGVSAMPDALVLLNPALDTEIKPLRVERFGSAETARALNPMRNVKPGMPPLVVLHARDDQTCVIAEVFAFEAKMKAAGNRCDLALWDTGGHGFFNYFDGKNPHFTETCRAIDRFLVSLGWLEGEPTIDAFRDRMGLAEEWLAEHKGKKNVVDD